MTQMARVFSKLASPRVARVVSLGRQNIRGSPLILRPEVVSFILCKSGTCDLGKKYVSNGERVLETITSTRGEGGVAEKAEYKRRTI